MSLLILKLAIYTMLYLNGNEFVSSIGVHLPTDSTDYECKRCPLVIVCAYLHENIISNTIAYITSCMFST